ncbi:MAG: hypothetical protein J3Q66DRAFT_417484 [Benniella sp.]|nr:MAG: hypothetical protein J3Q66DRAFT_417484 [Benniella sp.]
MTDVSDHIDIQASDVTKDRCISAGVYGNDSTLAEYKAEGKSMAIKTTLTPIPEGRPLSPSEQEQVQEEQRQLNKDSEILRKLKRLNYLNSPYFAKYIGEMREGNNTKELYIEFIPGTIMKDAKAKNELPQKKMIIKDCLTALDKLHGHGISHGDPHDRNVIVTENNAVKLIDFGKATDPADNAAKNNDLLRFKTSAIDLCGKDETTLVSAFNGVKPGTDKGPTPADVLEKLNSCYLGMGDLAKTEEYNHEECDHEMTWDVEQEKSMRIFSRSWNPLWKADQQLVILLSTSQDESEPLI